MTAEEFRLQVRQMLGQSRAAPLSPEGSSGVCVPLRLSGASDMAALVELVQRVAASPALAAAHAAGLLRFELRIEPAAAIEGESACCDACVRAEPCRCQGSSMAAEATATPLLRGVVTEREVTGLPANCRLVGLGPKAILTPLARDALQQRGIAVQPAGGRER